MGATNVHLLMGNHEQMMFDALTSNYEKDDSMMRYWLKYGGSETLPEFCKLPEDEQIAIMDYIANLPYTVQVKRSIHRSIRSIVPTIVLVLC